MSAIKPIPALDVSEFDTYVTLAKAISDPTRLRILQLIASSDEYPCTELERRLPVGKSTISHHIKVLSYARLVRVRREGKFFHYRLRRDVLDYYLPHMIDRLADEEDPAETLR